jgi:Putative F0F1-ATPase subunit Ca2+/Mg2+ transporter
MSEDPPPQPDGEPRDGSGDGSGGGSGRPVADLPGAVAFASMGMTIAACEGLGVFLGIWADDRFRSAPAGLIIGIVLGSVVAVLSVVKQVRRFL